MKTATLFTGICALIATASAALEITIPDSYTEWYTGYTGLIQWNSSESEFGLLCNIQLIDVKTTEVVYNLTNTSISCSLDNYTTPILPSFDHKYSLFALVKLTMPLFGLTLKTLKFLPKNVTMKIKLKFPFSHLYIYLTIILYGIKFLMIHSQQFWL